MSTKPSDIHEAVKTYMLTISKIHAAKPRQLKMVRNHNDFFEGNNNDIREKKT